MLLPASPTCSWLWWGPSLTEGTPDWSLLTSITGDLTPQPAWLALWFSPGDPQPPRCFYPSSGTEVIPPSPGTCLTSGLLISSCVGRMGLCLLPLPGRELRQQHGRGAIPGVVSGSVNQAIVTWFTKPCPKYYLFSHQLQCSGEWWYQWENSWWWLGQKQITFPLGKGHLWNFVDSPPHLLNTPFTQLFIFYFILLLFFYVCNCVSDQVHSMWAGSDTRRVKWDNPCFHHP